MREAKVIDWGSFT